MTAINTDEIDRLSELYSKSKLSENGKLRLVDAIIYANEKPVAGTTPRHSLEGHLALAEIQNSLVNRMWAGFGSAALAAQTLRVFGETGKRSSAFGPRRARVAAALENIISYRKLDAIHCSRPDAFRPGAPWAQDALRVPKELIGHSHALVFFLAIYFFDIGSFLFCSPSSFGVGVGAPTARRDSAINVFGPRRRPAHTNRS